MVRSRRFSPRRRLDKACIDQANIDANISTLPVFLSGCRTLLVLAGPTYATRLWCVVELFVWLRVGGDKERIKVAHLGSGGETQALFASFEAGKAKCFKPKDRQHLLAVMEAGFGDLNPFNRVVRRLLKERTVVRRTKTSALKRFMSSGSRSFSRVLPNAAHTVETDRLPARVDEAELTPVQPLKE